MTAPVTPPDVGVLSGFDQMVDNLQHNGCLTSVEAVVLLSEARAAVAAAVEEAETKALAQGWDEGMRTARSRLGLPPVPLHDTNPYRDAGQGGGS